MKAYRFELRDEIKWQWGFWAFYGFSFFTILMIGMEIGKPFLSWVVLGFYFLIYLIMAFDIIGYKIRRRND